MATGRHTQTPTTVVPAVDVQFAAFAESLELAMVAVYETLLPKLTADRVAHAARFRDHHQEHAKQFATLAGSSATGRPNGALLAFVTPTAQAVSTETDVLALAATLENQMTDTYAYALAVLGTDDIAARAIATLPVESAHASFLGAVAQRPVDTLFPTGAFENASVGDGTDGRRGFDPSTFPIG